MIQDPAAPQVRTSRPSLPRLAIASGSGTAIEYYDFLAYAIAAATIFPSLFFPSDSKFVSTILALGTFAVGFLVRPIGGIVFGHFGDRIGRKKMLVLTLTLMGAATVLIGVLPTYSQIGVAAPILLILLRLLQGFSAGGEFGGAALIAIEHAPPHRRGFYGSWTVLGTGIGAALASGLFALLGLMSDEAFASWGWRIPFLASVVIAAIGLAIRFGLDETPQFKEQEREQEPGPGRQESMPVIRIIREHPRTVILATGTLLAYSTFIYIVFTFLLSYGTGELGLSRNSLLIPSLLGMVLQIVSVPAWAALSDRIGRRPVMIAGGVFLAVFPFVLFPMVHTTNWWLILLALVIAYNGAPLMHAPVAAYFSELFGTDVRYTGVSLGYQLSVVLGGGLAPVIATALYAASGDSTVAVSAYSAGVALLSILCVAALPDTARQK